MPLCLLCLCVCLVAYGRALTAPTPGLTLLMPPGVPDLCYAGTPTPAVIWSRCQIPPLHPSTASPLSRQALLRSRLCAEASLCFSCCHSFLSVNTTYLASPFILTPPTNGPHVLWVPASFLSEFSTSLTDLRELCPHPPISIRPFSPHFVCVFTSPSHHVRQKTAAAIACLPSWTAWPWFQFPQGRLPRR